MSPVVTSILEIGLCEIVVISANLAFDYVTKLKLSM